MRHKFSKELFTHRTGGEPPGIVVAATENLQSKFIVQKTLELREQGIPLNEIAILFRSGFLSFDLEIELNKANIPFAKFGGFKFVETAHVKDLVAHLRVLDNPRDAVAWNRILLLVDGVGPRTAEKVIGDLLAGKGERTSLRRGAEPPPRGLVRSDRLSREDPPALLHTPRRRPGALLAGREGPTPHRILRAHLLQALR